MTVDKQSLAKRPGLSNPSFRTAKMLVAIAAHEQAYTSCAACAALHQKRAGPARSEVRKWLPESAFLSSQMGEMIEYAINHLHLLGHPWPVLPLEQQFELVDKQRFRGFALLDIGGIRLGDLHPLKIHRQISLLSSLDCGDC